MSIAETIVRRLKAAPNMRALAREADVAEKTLYRIRDAKRNDGGEFDYSPSIAIAEKILAALDALQPEPAVSEQPAPTPTPPNAAATPAPTTHVEPTVAIKAAADAHPVACDDPQLNDAKCLLSGEPRNEYERYIGHKKTREGDKPSGRGERGGR